MTASSGAGPERPPELTRPDQPLPQRPPAVPPQAPGGTATATDLPLPSPPPASAPDGGGGDGDEGRGGANWHRWHYPIGAFLACYGLTSLVTTAIDWAALRAELGGYLGSGAAVPALVLIKVVQVLLVLITLAGMVRRRDVWFLPALFGWAAGFGAFMVLDVVKGKWAGLLEHGAYLAGFAVLLFLSYGFSVKARVGRAAPAAPEAAAPQPDAAPRPSGLTRTQEFALAALSRWQRGQQPDPSAPGQGPQPGAAQAPPQGPPPGGPGVPPQGPPAGP
ncbi:hypothetical protein ACQEU3_28345 [Spirillospora sp. CA-253888]